MTVVLYLLYLVVPVVLAVGTLAVVWWVCGRYRMRPVPRRVRGVDNTWPDLPVVGGDTAPLPVSVPPGRPYVRGGGDG